VNREVRSVFEQSDLQFFGEKAFGQRFAFLRQ